MHSLSPILKTVEVTLCIQTYRNEKKTKQKNIRKTVKSYIFPHGNCAIKNILENRNYNYNYNFYSQSILILEEYLEKG